VGLLIGALGAGSLVVAVLELTSSADVLVPAEAGAVG
jgi:hypothetical protein